MIHNPRAQRLDSIRALAQREEQQALTVWGNIQKKVQAEEAQQQQLAGYAAEYQRQLSSGQGGRISAAALHNTAGFLVQIDQAVQAQKKQLALLHQQAQDAQQIWQEKHARVQSYDRLIEKLEDDYQQQQERTEQKLADEWASRRQTTPFNLSSDS